MSATANSFILVGKNILVDDKVGPAGLLVENGKITRIVEGPSELNPPKGMAVLDAGLSTVLPGIVDTHAHINEPGRTEWEGFHTATRAAAAGGVTTVVDMPLNSIPPTTNAANLEVKWAAARDSCFIDFGFWGGLIPGNLKDLPSLIDQGVAGVKAFMCESGVPEFPMAREEDLSQGMKVLAKHGVPLIVHAELLDDHAMKDHANQTESRSYRDYLNSRPPHFEIDAIKLLIKLTRETGCACHVVHLSAAAALDDIRAARAEGLPFTVETCPHYLTFEAEQIDDGATFFKCAPPIRSHENRERLWRGLVEGDIDMIVSDHSPCTPALKNLEKGDFLKAWGGISGIQMSLPSVWTEMKKRNLSLVQLSKWMSERPAGLAGLHQKGRLAVGFDADFLFFEPEQQFKMVSEGLFTRHSISPYNGGTFYGKVIKTFVRGQPVFDSALNPPFSTQPIGHRVRRENPTQRMH